MTDFAGASDTAHRYYDPRERSLPRDFRWPDGRLVAFAIVLCAEHYELAPDKLAYAPVNVPGMFGRGPYPDIASFSRREFGNRVGFFRVADLLERHGLQATAAIDAGVARRCRSVVEEALDRGWAIAGHGRSVNEVISSRMSVEEELDYIVASLQTLRGRVGDRAAIAGWHGPEYAESAHTPRLLAQAKVSYLLDWPHGEQPVFMQTDAGPILSIPMCADFDDVHAMWHRRITPERWAQAIDEAMGTLTGEDAIDGARLYVLNLHAWLIGQAFRAHTLDVLLGRLRQRRNVWFATTDEIASWCWAQLPRPLQETPA